MSLTSRSVELVHINQLQEKDMKRTVRVVRTEVLMHTIPEWQSENFKLMLWVKGICCVVALAVGVSFLAGYISPGSLIATTIVAAILPLGLSCALRISRGDAEEVNSDGVSEKKWRRHCIQRLLDNSKLWLHIFPPHSCAVKLCSGVELLPMLYVVVHLSDSEIQLELEMVQGLSPDRADARITEALDLLKRRGGKNLEALSNLDLRSIKEKILAALRAQQGFVQAASLEQHAAAHGL